MAVSEQLKALVEQMPNPDGRGMFTENIDKDKIEAAIAAIRAGGPDNIRGLIEMLGEPGTDADVKPHYALHCVANSTLIAKDENARRAVCETLAAELDREHSKYIKGFLCQTLQWAGHRESVAALGKLLGDGELCDPAAMALVAIRDGAAEQLRAALPNAQGRCRLTIIHALAALADGASAGTFQEAFKDENVDVRLAAGSGLANIGDAGAIDSLLKAADAEPGWERIQATKHCLLLAEKLLAAGKKSEAQRVYQHLLRTRTDPAEAYIRLAAAKGLSAA